MEFFVLISKQVRFLSLEAKPGALVDRLAQSRVSRLAQTEYLEKSQSANGENTGDYTDCFLF